MFGFLVLIIILIIVLFVLISCVKIVPQAHAYVLERLGGYKETWSVGIHFKMPILDRVARKVSLKEQVVDFEPQAVITKDNVTMQIDTVVYYQITDPKLFAYGVERPMMAIENLTATTLRNIIGDLELDETLTSRDTVNTKMRAILDEAKCKIGNYASRISHFEHFVVLSYYYQGLGEAAISVLNEIKETKLVAGIEHFNMIDNYEMLCCPANLVIASRVKDLASSYKNNLISVEQLEEYIQISALTVDEIIYLYSRLLFPSEFMQLAINDDCNDAQIKKTLLNMYQNIDNQKASLVIAWQMLNKYTRLPKIAWL